MGKIIKLSRLGLIIGILGLLSACVSIPKPQPDLSNPILTVAVLPFANQSNNVDAPAQIRDLLSKKLMTKFYRVIPLQEIDQIMVDELGVTLGEQLSEVELSEVKSKIKADGYLYGDILHYDQTTAGVLNTNRVSAKLQLIQGSGESLFWSSNVGIKSESKSGGMFGSLASLASMGSDSGDAEIQWITIERKTGGDGSIMGNLISGLVDKAVSSAFGATLTHESTALVNNSVKTLRNGPGF